MERPFTAYFCRELSYCLTVAPSVVRFLYPGCELPRAFALKRPICAPSMGGVSPICGRWYCSPRIRDLSAGDGPRWVLATSLRIFLCCSVPDTFSVARHSTAQMAFCCKLPDQIFSAQVVLLLQNGRPHAVPTPVCGFLLSLRWQSSRAAGVLSHDFSVIKPTRPMCAMSGLK